MMKHTAESQFQFLTFPTDKVKETQTTESQIRSFAMLPNGWDYGEGVPLTKPAMKLAIEINSLGVLNGFISEAIPHTEGGITLIFSMGDYFLDVSVDQDLMLSTRIEKGRGLNFKVIEEKENVDKIDIVNELIKVSQWYLLEQLTLLSTVQRRADLKKMHSLLQGEEYQYLPESVLC